jgi:hypothetical protein
MSYANNFNNSLTKFYNNNSKSNLIDLKKKFLQLRKNCLDKNEKFVLFKKFGTSKKKLLDKIEIFSHLSKLLSQNDKNEIIIEVRANKKLLDKYKNKSKKNLRYHQTNLGGSIHTDGPQLLTPPKYILMACAEQANNGGFSIISDAEKIYKDLKIKQPNILKNLKKKFLFERRGFKEQKIKFLSKKIFETSNTFKFRYLRDYIESSYKNKKKLNSFDIKCFDMLDKYLQNKKYQKKYKMNKGDLVIMNNFKLAHGRTKFSVSDKKQRNLLRVWLEK